MAVKTNLIFKSPADSKLHLESERKCALEFRRTYPELHFESERESKLIIESSKTCLLFD